MKYSEFKGEMIKNGYRVVDTPEEYLYVYSGYGADDYIIAKIAKDLRCVHEVSHIVYEELLEDEVVELFVEVTELSSTPLEEREDEKKYFLKLSGIDERFSYLNHDLRTGALHFGTKFQEGEFETQFFEGDIKSISLNIKNETKYLIDMCAWEEVEA